MILIDKLNAFLGKFVGPNAAHMIDAFIAIGLTFAGAFTFSPAARTFGAHHARLGLILLVVPPIATALAAKFRKAAGSSAPLADQLVAAVTDAVHEASKPAQ